MDGDILDPDGARERLNAWKGRIDKLAADTRAMSDRLQEVRITASDPSGLAEVTIDSTGALVDLKLTARMQRMSPDQVAQTILATVGTAKGQLADQSREIIADTVGADSAAGRAIAESVGRHLGGTPAPEQTSTEGDEDFENRSYLEGR